MKKTKRLEIPLEIAAVIFVIILIGFSVTLSNFWHSFVFWKPETIAFYLLEYPKEINDKGCFVVVMDPRYLNNVRESPLIIRVNNNVVYWENIFFMDEPIIRKICIDGNSLKKGDNFVFLHWYDRKLFFHLKKADKEINDFADVKDLNWDSNKRILKFRAEGNISYVKPISIFINNKLVRRVYPTKKNQTFEEKILLEDLDNGKNTIKIEANNVVKKIEFNFEKKNFDVVGFFVMALLLLGLFLEFKNPMLEKFLFSFLAFTIILITLPFILNFLGLLQIFHETAIKICIFIIGLLLIIKNKNELNFITIDEIKSKILKLLRGELPIFALILFFHIILFYHLFSLTYYTYWNIFYERQSSLIIENFSIPFRDELSYLGRNFTASLGYPLLEASISWLTAFKGKFLFATMLVLGNILFILACFYFCKKLKFNLKQSALFYLLLSFCMFILTGMIVSPRHIISFAFVIAFLGITLANIKWKYSGTLLGFNGVLQAPMLLFAPIFSLFLGANFKKQLKNFLLGGIITLIFFVPFLLHYGLPTQAKSSSWGYLIKMPIQNLFFETGMLLIFIFFFGILDLIFKKQKFDWLEKRALLAIIAGILIELFVTYRWNIFTSLALGIFICSISKNYLENIFSKRLLYVLIFLSAFSSLNIIYNWIAPSYALHAINFVKLNVSSSENVLADPLFGHSLTGIAHKRVLADLCVEYAPKEKLEDTYKFLETADKEILKKYNINVVVNQGDIINKDAMHNEPLNYELDFEFLDKIFDNKFLFVHRVFW